MSNAAIEAVRAVLFKHGPKDIRDVIAAVLDHMPREAMARAIIRLLNKCGGDYPAPPEDFVDAALSAARAVLLPASSLRPSGYGSASLGEAPEGSVDGHDKPGDAPGETGGE